MNKAIRQRIKDRVAGINIKIADLEDFVHYDDELDTLEDIAANADDVLQICNRRIADIKAELNKTKD